MVRWASSLVLIAACGFPRPADVADPKSCIDGICTDPNYPFCDEGGEISGAAKTCVAVSCAPGEFAACRGDVELSCNSAGTTYDALQCALGCAPAIGCRLCEPNQTVCANGKVQTCDASGAVISSEICPLGCFEDQPRCRTIDPSNGLGMYLDMVTDPPSVDLSSGGTINTSTGVVSTSTEVVLSVPTFLVGAQNNGAQIRVVVAHDVHLRDVIIKNDEVNFGGPALAILATGDITLAGHVQVHAGDLTQGACVGGKANAYGIYSDGTVSSSGSGGGAHATNGGSGGSAAQAPAGVMGLASGTATLVPLRGGCASGGADDFGTPQFAIGVRGGGAIQLSSRTAIRIDGSLDANGFDGFDVQTLNSTASFGGGGGGGLLLEAPSITIGQAGALLTKGGGGAGCSPPDTCTSGNVSYGAGGAGATNNSPAMTGGNSTTTFGAGGGGGGGLGRIRINTPDGTYSQTNTSTLEGAVTTGNLATR